MFLLLGKQALLEYRSVFAFIHNLFDNLYGIIDMHFRYLEGNHSYGILKII